MSIFTLLGKGYSQPFSSRVLFAVNDGEYRYMATQDARINDGWGSAANKLFIFPSLRLREHCGRGFVENESYKMGRREVKSHYLDTT